MKKGSGGWARRARWENRVDECFLACLLPCLLPYYPFLAPNLVLISGHQWFCSDWFPISAHQWFCSFIVL